MLVVKVTFFVWFLTKYVILGGIFII